MKKFDKNCPKTAEVRVGSVADVESALIQRGRSKSLLVSSWTDWPKNRRHAALLANLTSSSLTNLRVQPGTETLNSAVLLRKSPPAAIVEDELDNAEDDDDEEDVVITEKTPKLFGARYMCNKRVLCVTSCAGSPGLLEESFKVVWNHSTAGPFSPGDAGQPVVENILCTTASFSVWNSRKSAVL